MFYSVPYQYIKEKVDVRITDIAVEVYSKNERIASHRRLTGRPGQYSTQIDHMPKDHQQYLEWNGDRFRRWAKEVGPNTYKVIDAILASNKIEQQKYRSCMGIIRLADKHTKAQLETVCRKALTYSGVPSYKGIKNLFATLKAEDLDEYHEKSAVLFLDEADDKTEMKILDAIERYEHQTVLFVSHRRYLEKFADQVVEL